MIENTSAGNRSNSVPVSVISGFLGSGKTTLLNRLVQHPDMSDAAVIVNEFGDVGIDHALVDSALENTVVMDSGCLCCTMRGDFVDTVSELFENVKNGRIPAFSKILIEPTGLADPGPIIHAIDQLEMMDHPCHRDAIITLIDGQQGNQQFAKHIELSRQIAVADIVLITKVDIAGDQAVESLRHRIHGVNPGIPIRSIVQGEIDIADLFGLAQKSVLTVAESSPHSHDHEEHHHENGDAEHGGIQTHSITTDQRINGEGLRCFLETIFSLRGASFLRMKGIVWLENADEAIVIQGVGNTFGDSSTVGRGVDDSGITRLVFIYEGLNGDAIEQSFRAMVLNGQVG
jgi:G3E family GTPase